MDTNDIGVWRRELEKTEVVWKNKSSDKMFDWSAKNFYIRGSKDYYIKWNGKGNKELAEKNIMFDEGRIYDRTVVKFKVQVQFVNEDEKWSLYEVIEGMNGQVRGVSQEHIHED